MLAKITVTQEHCNTHLGSDQSVNPMTAISKGLVFCLTQGEKGEKEINWII